MLDAVQTLKKQGKKLYYISDMYLPQTQIDAMLRRCGYPCFDGGFVSCTYGVQKRSGRLLFRLLTMLYRQYQEPEILNAICSILIKTDCVIKNISPGIRRR